MLYRHDTENCFVTAIGARGLADEEYAATLAQTGAALKTLSQAYADNSLPLLRLAEMDEDLQSIKPLAERWRQDFDDVIVLGTGGSSLGGQTVCALADVGFGPRMGAPRLHFIDNIDPHTFEALFEQVGLERSGFIVISKSGGTAETITQFLICLKALEKKAGDTAATDQFLIITEPGDNPLRQIAASRDFSVLDHDPGIGGRFSVLSLVGMLPAMIAGLDPVAIRCGAGAVLKTALDAKTPADCPSAVGAAINVSLFKNKGASSTVLMPYADRLDSFAMWFQQLWGESLGKDGTGTTPIGALGTRDQHSQLQLYLDGPHDKMFTLLTLEVAGAGGTVNAMTDERLAYLNGRTMGDLLEAEQRATAAALVDKGCPTRMISINELDEQILGALLMHFMLETIIAAHLLGVNPYDQPAVEAGKQLARRFLSEMDDPA
jgi:glucose-6-phosphate isomerase